MDYGKKIKELRKLNKLSQVDLGKIIGVDRSAISSYETGRRKVSLHRLKQLSKALHVKIDYFLDEDSSGYSFYVDNIDKKMYEILLATFKEKMKK